MTPLHAVYLAPSSSQAQCGRLLVDSGADVDALDAWGRTPIQIAAGFNNTSPEFLTMLIQKGANINRRDIYGQSALLKSIQGRKEATELLLYHGADTEARDEYGNTPILEAIYRDRPLMSRRSASYRGRIVLLLSGLLMCVISISLFEQITLYSGVDHVTIGSEDLP
ncbi:ankyrin repeat-containing domain protein [Xylaria digitata]|nr:ankyrin repeat-containing domain protein [Xylaria digitata]